MLGAGKFTENLDAHIRDAGPSDVSSLSRVLARAFRDDPAHRWIFPAEEQWRRGSHRRFAGLLTDSIRHGLVTTTEDLKGAAIWAPPAVPLSYGHLVASLWLVLRVTGWRAALLLKGHRMLDQAAPDRPHWYLRVVGVAPQYQRHGVGMVLLRPALERCDREGTPAYLVASQCKNVPFYEQQGFRVTAELRLPRGPLMWPMIREPRTAD